MDLKNKIEQLKKSKSESSRKECIPLLQSFLAENSDDVEAWYDLAGCYDYIGEELEAESCYKKVYELGFEKLPLNERANFFIGYGSTLRNNFNFFDSSQVLKKGIEIFPNNSTFEVFLALTLYSEGKYKQASEQLFKAVSKIQNKVFDGYENAIQWYCKNLELHPKREPPKTIIADRVILRAISESDVDSIFEYCSIPEVSKYTLWEVHRSIEDSMKLVDYAKSNYQRGMIEPLAITLKGSNKLIGTVGWYWNSERYKSIELAYALSPQYWGKGLVLEACRSLVNESLKNNEILRITSRCIAENKASARVMEKLGMQCEGIQKQLIFVKGQFVDIKNYCILAKDWI